MTWWLLLVIFLFFACAALIVAEVFLPSGGILSISALACVVGGVVICFRYNPAAGWISIVVAVVMIPALLVGAYKILPSTSFGKRVILSQPVRQRGDAIADGDQLAALMGQIGKVLTPLRPVGTCDFAGRRVECVAESGYVPKGREVQVIRVEGTQLTVRVTEQA
jgi:membrane-bound serine protease (ClpP class)